MNINLAKIDFAYKNQGGDAKPEVKLKQTITENGLKTFNPPTEYVYSSAEITVDVPATPTQEKAVQITENKVTEITPDPNFLMSKVTVTTNIPQPTLEENKTQEITANGQTVISPTDGNDAMKQVTLNVNVPEKTFKTQTKTETVTENKTISVTPDEGFDGLTKVDVTVNVPTNGDFLFDPSNITGLEYYFPEANIEYELFSSSGTTNLTCLETGENITTNTYTPTKVGIYHFEGSIPNFVFSNNKNILSIRYLSNITDNVRVDFTNCTNLTYINLCGVTNIADYNAYLTLYAKTNYDSNTFFGCSNLVETPDIFINEENVINDFFYSIGSSFISDCKKLKVLGKIESDYINNIAFMFESVPTPEIIKGLYFKNCTSWPTFYDKAKLKYISTDFSSVESEPKLFFGDSGKNVRHFSIRGVLKCSYTSLFRNCPNLDYESIKSWLIAALNSENSYEINFTNFVGISMPINDINGEIQDLVQKCTDKGWVISGLQIN